MLVAPAGCVVCLVTRSPRSVTLDADGVGHIDFKDPYAARCVIIVSLLIYIGS